MENCCYDKRGTIILNMVQQGVSGEIVHCSGSYAQYIADNRPQDA